MEKPSPDRVQKDVDAVLRIMRYETWSLVTVITALIVGAGFALVLQATGTKTAGVAIFIVALCVAMGGTAAWLTTVVLANRADQARWKSRRDRADGQEAVGRSHRQAGGSPVLS